MILSVARGEKGSQAGSVHLEFLPILDILLTITWLVLVNSCIGRVLQQLVYASGVVMMPVRYDSLANGRILLREGIF